MCISATKKDANEVGGVLVTFHATRAAARIAIRT